ncbi:MAG: hypothetical protein ABW061_04910 [Polyangiaceae bacterium]
MLGAALVVLVVGGGRAPAVTAAFEAAARGVLGVEAKIQIIGLDEVPSDEEAVARASRADGVVELIWTKDGTNTRLHCYVSREHRWVDREISFGGSDPNSARDASERGRLLGYAVATMFADELELAPAPSPPAKAPPSPLPLPGTRPFQEVRTSSTHSGQKESTQPSLARRALEFSGVASSGVGGTASSLGAAAGVRAPLAAPLFARVFVAGRAGSVARAQVSTLDARLGGGLTIAVQFEERRFELGLRSDLFISHFNATHLSEDDVTPDRRSRWLPGADLIAEGGFRFAGNAGLFVGAGGEAMFGKTDLYTHGQRVAVVPVLRLVGEVGFRIGF